MKVAVCCKGVPTDVAVDIAEIKEGDIGYTSTDFYINEFDAYALEAALNIKKLKNAETVAVSLGPLRSQEVLYFALAKGIDRAIRIDGQTGRPELVAKGLIPVLQEINPELILVGVQSEDWMGGEIGTFLARALGMSMAFAVVEIQELNDSGIRVRKEMGGGKIEEVALKLPAVLCIQSGIHQLQYISKIRLKKARSLSIDSGGSVDSRTLKESMPGLSDYELVAIAEPARKSEVQFISGERAQRAAKLIEIITKLT